MYADAKMGMLYLHNDIFLLIS